MSARKKKPKRQRKAPTGTITGPCMDTCWQTPPELVTPVRRYFGGRIPFDAATAPDNPCKARRFVTEEQDGLAMRWPARVWVNPPYGKALRLWLPKIAHEAELGSEIITLIPCARFEQYYYQFSMVQANAKCLIRKRVKFIRPSTGDRVAGNPYANMFVGFNVDEERFAEHFGHLGMCQSVRCLSAPAVEELPAEREARIAAAKAAKAEAKREREKERRNRRRRRKRRAA
jgi:phage N-6-adenine-methyltransferase